MQRLEPPDTHRLLAAVGWMELGNRTEAGAELDAIAAQHQSHPDVLEVRWALYAGERRWDAALETARNLLLRAPDRASGWLDHAYALRRAPEGGLQKAWDALRPAFDKFPKEPTIPYNLSCYACQLQRLDEARVWLKQAVKIGGKGKIKRMALEDSDLKPLWDEIRQL